MDAAQFEELRKVVGAMVRQNSRIADSTGMQPSILIDELVGDVGVRVAAGKFDPSKGKFSGWAWAQAWGLMDDLASKYLSRKAIDGRIAAEMSGSGLYSFGDGVRNRICGRNLARRKHKRFAFGTTDLIKIPDRAGHNDRRGPGLRPYINAHLHRLEHHLTMGQVWLDMRCSSKLAMGFGFKHCPGWHAFSRSLRRIKRVARKQAAA